MANFKIVFNGSYLSSTDFQELVTYMNGRNELYLEVKSSISETDQQYIVLDLETAIMFSKEIKKVIAEIRKTNI